MELICGAYPRFYYPKGTGFYSGNVNNILCETRSGEMTAEKIYNLFREFNGDVRRVLREFICSKEDVREWAKDIENDEETEIESIIENDYELSWWDRVGTKKNKIERKKFEQNIISAKANAIMNCALTLIKNGVKVKKVKEFKLKAEEYDVVWMDELKPFMEKY